MKHYFSFLCAKFLIAQNYICGFHIKSYGCFMEYKPKYAATKQNRAALLQAPPCSGNLLLTIVMCAMRF